MAEPTSSRHKHKIKKLESELKLYSAEVKQMETNLKTTFEQVRKKRDRLGRRGKRLEDYNVELADMNSKIQMEAMNASESSKLNIDDQEEIKRTVDRTLKEYLQVIPKGELINARGIDSVEKLQQLQITEPYLQIVGKMAERNRTFANSGENESLVQVEVIYEDQFVAFNCGPVTTFEELRKLVSPYWGLPEKEVFFSDEPSDSHGKIYMMQQVVAAELYPWRTLRLNENTKIYVTLTGYQSVEEQLEPFLQIADPEVEDISQDTAITDRTSVYKLGRKPWDNDPDKEEDPKEAIQKRMKQHFIANIFQSILFNTLIILWVVFLSYERNTKETSWMNYSIESTLIGDSWRKHHEYYSTYNTLSSSNQNLLYTITNKNQIYEYLDYIRNSIYASSINPTSLSQMGAIDSFNYVLDYINVRQVRSQIHDMDVYDEDRAVAQSWDRWPSQEDYGHPPEFQYEDDARLFGVHGLMRDYYYGNSGYSFELPAYSVELWIHKQTQVDIDQWIDIGTRMVCITINIVNPNIHAATVANVVFEVDDAGNVAPSYRLSSFDVDMYSSTSIILQVFIQLLIIGQWIILLRDLGASESEVTYFAYRNMPDKQPMFEPLDETLEEWRKNDKKTFLKRIRSPFASEIINFATFIIVTLLQAVRLIWYFEVFQPNFDLIEDEYIDLTIVAESYNLLAAFDSIVTIMLFVSVVKYVLFWVSTVAMITSALRAAWASMKLFILLSFIVIIGFVVFHFFTMGPYHISLSTMVKALCFFLQVFLGSYNQGREGEVFVSPVMLLVSLGFFFLFKQIVWYQQIINVSHQLKFARDVEVKTVVEQPVED